MSPSKTKETKQTNSVKGEWGARVLVVVSVAATVVGDEMR